MKQPTSLPAFRRWLADQFSTIEALTTLGEPDYYTEVDVADRIEEAYRLACRFGAGDIVGAWQPTIQPREALAIIGRLLAWAEQPLPSDLLSVEEVADKLGTSARTVWRMLSADEIPQPVKIGSLTKWRRSEVQAMIDLLPSIKR